MEMLRRVGLGRRGRFSGNVFQRIEGRSASGCGSAAVVNDVISVGSFEKLGAEGGTLGGFIGGDKGKVGLRSVSWESAVGQQVFQTVIRGIIRSKERRESH